MSKKGAAGNPPKREDIPWSARQDIMNSFAHDHTEASFAVAMAAFGLDAALKEARPDISERFKAEYGATPGSYVREAHDNMRDLYRGLYRRAEPPSDEELTAAKEKLKSAQSELRARAKRLLELCGTSGPRLVSKKAADLRRMLKAESRFDVGRITKLKPMRRPVDLHQALRDFSTRDFVDRDGIPVKVNYRGKDVGRVLVDPRLLIDRGLHNLVTDSITHGKTNKPVEIRLIERKGELAIHVTNRGPKLSKKDLQAIGRVRWTQHPEDPKRGHGKISARIMANLHGGTLEVKNFKRKGRHYGPRLSLVIKKTRATRPR